MPDVYKHYNMTCVQCKYILVKHNIHIITSKTRYSWFKDMLDVQVTTKKQLLPYSQGACFSNNSSNECDHDMYVSIVVDLHLRIIYTTSSLVDSLQHKILLDALL